MLKMDLYKNKGKIVEGTLVLVDTGYDLLWLTADCGPDQYGDFSACSIHGDKLEVNVEQVKQSVNERW